MNEIKSIEEVLARCKVRLNRAKQALTVAKCETRNLRCRQFYVGSNERMANTRDINQAVGRIAAYQSVIADLESALK